MTKRKIPTEAVIQLRQPPAVRFQAESSNQCWHFDLSPSDLKYVKTPAWIKPGRGKPLLMLGGRSG